MNRTKCGVIFIVSFLLLVILVGVAYLKIWFTTYKL
jgi:regulatory protein YycI of two-component signal transduction system YycFG